MKFAQPSTLRQRATSLVTTLVITSIIASIFAAYLTLISSRTRQTFRNQTWESCIPICEAGVEEALVHLNNDGISGIFSNGWVQTNGKATLTRSIGQGYYSLNLSTNTNSVVTIEARGYVPIPYARDSYLSRNLRVTCEPKPIFPYAIVTEDKNEIAGTVDSFNSSSPSASTNGLYDLTLARDQAFVGANKKNKSKILKIKSKAKVYGNIAVGAGSTTDVSGSASVGDNSWINGSNTGVQSGHSSDDMNLYFPPVSEPFLGGYWTPSSGTVGGTNYTYVLGTGDYQLSSLKLDKDEVLLVTGEARLKVTGKIEVKKEGLLWVNTNASLKVYAADDVKIEGALLNATGYATNFALYGLPTNTKISIKAKSKKKSQPNYSPPFIGTIYAPSAATDIDGPTELMGGIVSYEFKAGKDTLIHYDEALGKPGGSSFIITAWDEF